MPMNPDEHERLTRVDERTAAMKETLDELVKEVRGFAATQARHDERLKLVERGGGSALGVVLAVLAALLKDKFHL